MGIDRKTLASIIGLLSIVSSLAFWIEVALGKTLGHVPGWIDMGLNGWVAGWVLGVVLAGAATILWPKRWWWALLVAPLSFFALLVSVRNVDPSAMLNGEAHDRLYRPATMARWKISQ